MLRATTPGGVEYTITPLGRAMPLPHAVAASVFGCMAAFIGVLLLLCERDLKTRGSIVMWEGVLRLVAGCIMKYFTAEDTFGTMARSRPCSI